MTTITSNNTQPWRVDIEPWHEPFPWRRAIFVWVECVAFGLLAGMVVALAI